MSGLDVGNIFATLGFRVDDTGADRWERRVTKDRVEAAKPINVPMGADVDERGFETFDRRVRQSGDSAGLLTGILGRLRGAQEQSAQAAAAAAAEQEKVADAQDKARRAATAMEAASIGVERAQRTLSATVKKHGQDSLEARDATVKLAMAQDALSDAAAKAKTATGEVDDAVRMASRGMVDFDRDGNRGVKTFLSLSGGAGGARLSVGAFSGSLGELGGTAARLGPILLALGAAVTALVGSLGAAAAGAAALGAGFVAAMGPVAAVTASVADRLGDVKDAYDAVKKAQKDGSEASRKAADEAMAGLSDTEKSAVRAFGTISDAYRKAFGGATDSVIGGLASSIDTISPVLERLRKPLTEVGEAMASSMERVARALSGDGTVRSFERFAEVGARLLVPLTDVVLDLAEAFLNVAEGALPYVEKALDGLARWTGTLSAGTRDTKEVSRVIGELVEHLDAWLDLTVAVGKAMFLTFAGAAESGKRLIGVFTDITNGYISILPAIGKVKSAVGEGLSAAVSGTSRELAQFARRNQENADDISRAFESLLGPARKTLDGIRDAFGDVFGKDSDVGSDLRVIADTVADFVTFLVTDFVAPVTKRILPALEQSFRGLLLIVRGVVRVIAGILTLDFQKAWQGVKDIFAGGLQASIGQMRMATAPIREVASRLWQPIATAASAVWKTASGVFRDGLDAILGGVTTYLGLIQKVADAGSKLPGVGGKFRDLGNSIRDARRQVDQYRESLRDTDKEHGRTTNIRRLQGEVDDLRGKMRGLRRGSDEYNDTAEQLRKKQRQLNDAMRDARPAATRASGGIRNLGQAADAASDGVADAFSTIAQNVNSLAEELGAKGIKFRVAKTKSGRRTQAATFGAPGSVPGISDDGVTLEDLGRKERGGFLDGPGMGRDVIPVLAGADEAFLTAHQQGPVEQALAITHALGLGDFPSLDSLFGRVQTPHTAFAPRYAQGGKVNLLGANPALAKYAIAARRFGLSVTSGLRQGSITSSGNRSLHADGYALDLSNGYATPQELAFGKYAAAKWGAGLDELIHTPLGYGIKNGRRVPPYAAADHYDHVHIGDRTPGSGGGLGDFTLPGVSVTGPAGGMLRVVQAAANRGTRQGNAFLGDQATVPVNPGGGKHGDGMTKAQLRALWVRAGGSPSNANLMAAIALAESSGNPAANGPPDGRGLWQIEWPVWGKTLGRLGNPYNPLANAKMARAVLARQGLGAWVVYNTGAYRQFLSRGGFVRRARGGRSKRPMMGRGEAYGNAPITTRANRLASLRTRRDAIRDYDNWISAAESDDKLYARTERLYNISEEELVNEQTGEVDEAAVAKRTTELVQLGYIQARYVDNLRKARKVAATVVRSYKNVLGRLRQSLKYASKKDRKGIRADISNYQGRLDEWLGKIDDVGGQITDAEIDRVELGRELSAVRGTTASPPAADSSSTPDSADPGATTDTSPTAQQQVSDAQAIADQANAAAADLRETVRLQTAALMTFGGAGDIGAGGYGNAFGAAVGVAGAGGGPIGGGSPLGGAFGADGGGVTVVIQSSIPPTPEQARDIGRYAADGLFSASPAASPRVDVGL